MRIWSGHRGRSAPLVAGADFLQGHVMRWLAGVGVIPSFPGAGRPMWARDR